MYATLVSVALFAAAAINGAAAQQLTVSTPQFTTCQSADITWSATQGPYNLIMVAPGGCDAVVDLGDQDGTSTTWTPNIAPGTQLELSLMDASGQEAWSGTITVAQGSDTSCVPADVLASASASSSASSSSSESSAASVSVTGTTLVVSTSPSSSAVKSAATSSAAGPVGAVGNNGPLKASQNGAMTHTTAPVMILGLVFGIVAFCL